MHYCLGVFLARLETQIAIGAVLDRFSKLRLDAPRAHLRWRPSFLLRGLEALPVSTTLA
jgi:cytochrome P450